MVPIIGGEGNERDHRSLHMSTLDGAFLPNVRHPEDPPETRRKGIEDLRTDHPHVQLRSCSGVYNCVGHIFAARRTWVDNDHLPKILSRDGYSLVLDKTKLWKGDIVIYENAQGELSHVGQVMEIKNNVADGTREIVVLSKWGALGEYLHEVSDVPLILGKPKNFWSERREV